MKWVGRWLVTMAVFFGVAAGLSLVAGACAAVWTDKDLTVIAWEVVGIIIGLALAWKLCDRLAEGWNRRDAS